MRNLMTLTSDRRGTAAIEFALVTPILLLMLCGGADLAHTSYMRGVLQGTVDKAARDATLETGTATANQSVVDGRVRDAVLDLNSAADVTVTRRFYRTFSQAAAANHEPYSDNNGDGQCNSGEPYTDNNRNGVYDADGGDEGQGNARDIVIYSVDMVYDHMFPIVTTLGFSPRVTLNAKTFYANQPYGQQQSYGTPLTGNCT